MLPAARTPAETPFRRRPYQRSVATADSRFPRPVSSQPPHPFHSLQLSTSGSLTGLQLSTSGTLTNSQHRLSPGGCLGLGRHDR